MKAFAQPSLNVDVVEAGHFPRAGRLPCTIETNISFNTHDLESYCVADWDPVVFDAMVVAGAVEFCDRSKLRPSMGWSRVLSVSVPVHDPDRWGMAADSLRSALDLLTGDSWDISFRKRTEVVPRPREQRFNLPAGEGAVLPFSDGMDSFLVASLMSLELGDRLMRVRLGSKGWTSRRLERDPFASVPYSVRPNEGVRWPESSARSRGFKFAMLSGIAAHLSGATRVVMPESGQGALGTWLVPVGHAYEDYRNHPTFTRRMEVFLGQLFGRHPRFVFPRLWSTKGETLAEYLARFGGDEWHETWSCWRRSSWTAVQHRKRQCGICAACLLRRMSVHATGEEEDSRVYVWERLNSTTFSAGAARGFEKINRSYKEYAIAGALHLDHLASLPESQFGVRQLPRRAQELARTLGVLPQDARRSLDRMLLRHAKEWSDFVGGLGPRAFLSAWAA